MRKGLAEYALGLLLVYLVGGGIAAIGVFLYALG